MLLTEADLPFELESVVVCDDVRQEKSGKYILVGVYGGNILVPSLPVNLKLAVWMIGRAKEKGAFEIKFRVVGPNSVSLTEGVMGVQIHDADVPMILAIPALPFQMQISGELQFQVSQSKSKNWHTIKALQLGIAPKSPRVFSGGGAPVRIPT